MDTRLFLFCTPGYELIAGGKASVGSVFGARSRQPRGVGGGTVAGSGRNRFEGQKSRTRGDGERSRKSAQGGVAIVATGEGISITERARQVK